MFENGYIKLYRSMLSWEWYSDINTKVLFLHLLLTVNHEPKKWCGIDIERGQRICSLYTLSKETGLTIQQIRTALSHLESTGEITRSKNPQCTTISIKNYCLYQSSTQHETCEQQSINTASTHDQHILKNDKNDKNDKKQRKVYISSFDSFWNVYPKKKAKQDAQKAWDKLKPDDTLADTIIASVLRLSATNDWLKNNGQFIPFPATFLNGKRWEDEAQTGQAQFGNLHKLRQEMEALDEQG